MWHCEKFLRAMCATFRSKSQFVILVRGTIVHEGPDSVQQYTEYIGAYTPPVPIDRRLVMTCSLKNCGLQLLVSPYTAEFRVHKGSGPSFHTCKEHGFGPDQQFYLVEELSMHEETINARQGLFLTAPSSYDGPEYLR